MINPQIKFTYRDYLLLPEGDRRELIEGDFYMAPAPNIWHQTVVVNLGRLLANFVISKNLGVVLWAPTDVVLSQESVVQPDVLFISNARRHIIKKNYVSGAPDLVIEVLSRGTSVRDRQLKLRLYARYGVLEYWIVDPDARSVQVMVLGAQGYDTVRTYTSGAIESSVLPGLNLTLDEIFAAY
jgi:Uma2 family endonuclease